MALEDVRICCTAGMRFTLDRRSTLVLKRAAGTRILCLGGTVWLSEIRPAADCVLGTGQSKLLDNDRDVVLGGLPDAQVAILSPTEPAP
ncbi:DUF2917 domain-containing protein [Bordetella genomosp. 1]|uniref:DUF2917 domain-containing protein n=2 Tax=Bordetella genomosp. 1 TaxID=1395607 RepID=A0ABX4F4M7_9BORD|nr:DUF2917 domain-containing protein [Bordetella genomosp. 1]MDQ8034677.1 DUF2917 domain-containing protein [Bordetella sp.]OZI68698.1 hypothetical protein CAL27_04330 [Bordetella genomosp. 1]